jgi:RNA polymerase sigma-70 factor (ECF subfamily)
LVKGGVRVVEQYIIQERIDEFADTVYRVAFLYLRHRADAEEVAQEVFIKLCENDAAMYEPEILKAWLIRVSSNLCKNELKKFWRTRVDALDESYPAAEKHEYTDLTGEVLRLPVKYRDVIYLHYYEGYKTEEIAELLGAKPATIRTRLKRGRELLHGRLTKGGEDYAYESFV